MESGPYFIGVDVGTSSVRAALVTKGGNILATASDPIEIWEPEPGYYEQSSCDIWRACCHVVKMVTSNIEKTDVKGIGFDCTCSLVVLGSNGEPLPVSKSGDTKWNVIMWMDHRAVEETEFINKTKHRVLKYVGGKISIEMQTPKLAWLKKNMPITWSAASDFFDLPDFMTYKATNCKSRSLCSLACKWTYFADGKGESGWSEDFFSQIGLGDLIEDNFAKIGNKVLSPGDPCGSGLSEKAAHELGLVVGTPVATSIIDAHAGGIGTFCTYMQGAENIPLTKKLALICGTSTCHMAVNENQIFVPGVWGPFYSSMIPGLWTQEGGQSATGKLIDHVVENHPAYQWVKEEAESKQTHVFNVLNEILEFSAKKENVKVTELTKDVHVWPDYHGNRSPLADSSLKGMISGLTFANGAEDLAVKYLATIQALAYGTKHIIENMVACGHDFKLLLICGGLSKNKVFVQSHADILGLPVIFPDVSDSVLLGSALLGACAAHQYASIQEAILAMGSKGDQVIPNLEYSSFHQRKYDVFRKMVEHQIEYKNIMNS